MADLEHSHGRVDIAQNSDTVAVLVSAECLESLEETIAVATDSELVVAEGQAQLDAGQSSPAHEVEVEFLNRRET